MHATLEKCIAGAIRACFLLLLGACGAEQANGRPWVRNLTLAGAKAVPAGQLTRRLAIRETCWLRRPKRYLDPFAIDGDRARIEAFYRARGYFGARVLVAEAVPWRGPSDKPEAVDVRFVIEEGLPTQITEVEVRGLDAVPTRDALTRKLRTGLESGAVFEHGDYVDAKSALQARLLHLGHAWAEVEGRVEVDRLRHQARVQLTAHPGPLARFGRVRVEGLSRISERLVVPHAGITEGSRFDPDRLEEARGRIYALGVFASVREEQVQRESDPAVVDVLLRVREGSLNELRLGIGLGLDSYRTDLQASATYTRRNWLGGLRTLKLWLEPAWVAVPAFWNAQRTGPAVRAEAQLIQPDWPIPLGQLDLAIAYDVGVEYAYQFHGPRTSLGLQRGFWRDTVMLRASYNFQFLQFFNTDPVILEDPAQAGRQFGYTDPYRIGWFQQEVSLDLRDNPIEPHAGVYIATKLEEGGVYAGGAFQYEKIVPEVRAYAPLGSRVTLAGRFLFGQLFAHDDLGSPITRRFHLGGSNSHRGFNSDRLSPQIPSGQPGVAPIPIGGDQVVLISAELRVDVVRLFGSWLAVAGFVDGGDVGGSRCAGPGCPPPRTGVDWDDLHWAAGGGLRYRSILGAIRIDLGVRLNRLTPFQPDGAPNPDPGQRLAFHVSLGEAF